MYGNAFVHSLAQLPAAQQAHAGRVRGQRRRNPRRGRRRQSLHDAGKWGTTVVSNGTTYQWGMPIVRLDSTGQQAIIKIGSGNPRFHYGVSNNVSWKGFQFYGLLDTQMGGNIYNQNNQRSYQYNRSSDVDQTGKPDSLKKTVDYYALVYNGNAIEDWFVEPGGFVKLRELSVQVSDPEAIHRADSREPRRGRVGVVHRPQPQDVDALQGLRSRGRNGHQPPRQLRLSAVPQLHRRFPTPILTATGASR